MNLEKIAEAMNEMTREEMLKEIKAVLEKFDPSMEVVVVDPMKDFTVFWSEEDKEFVGLCKRYPSLSFLAKTKVEAEKGIRELVEALDE